MISDTSDDENLVESLAAEFAARRRRGECPSIAEYVDRHPELADEIRAFFPALALVEELKPGSDEVTGSFAGAASFGSGMPPERLGDFRILREIGRGGMGVVYQAEQESLGRCVALKVLGTPTLLDPQKLRRFHREARAAANLHHTNIVPVFGVGEEQGLHYYVMQFIPGLSLDEVLHELKRRRARDDGARLDGAPKSRGPELSATDVAQSLWSGRIPSVVAAAPAEDAPPAATASARPMAPTRDTSSSATLPGEPDLSAVTGSARRYFQSVARLGVQIAAALEYAHQQGTLHRDIKPSNLLLDAHGTVWITDFGLAKATDDNDLTHTGDVVGTVRYMAPERFRGRCDARSDIYALGLTLYELLAFRPAFPASDRHDLIRQISQEEPPRLRRLDPSVPRDLETIVHKALEKEPAHRYASARQMADDLQRFIDDRPIAARRSSLAERLRRWCRRNPVIAMLTAAVGLSLLSGIIASSYFAWQANRRYRQALASAWAADRARRELLERVYISDMQKAQEQWGQISLGVEDILARNRPDRTGGIDLRGFEWYFWKRQVRTSHRVLKGHEGYVWGLAYTPDGSHMATAGFDGTVRIWDIATGDPVRILRPARSSFTSVAFSPDGTCLAAAQGGGQFAAQDSGVVILWEWRTDRELRRLERQTGGVHSIAFSHDGRRLATAAYNGTARIWDVATGEARHIFSRRAGEMLGVAFSPDDCILATGHGSGVISLWDVTTGELQKTLTGHRDGVTCVAFSPDGSQLASSSRDSSARIWEVSSGANLRVLTVGGNWVQSVVWSRDGHRVLTASWDGTARVWDAASGEEKRRLVGHDSFVVSAVFSPDEESIATAGFDRTVRLWSVEPRPQDRLRRAGTASNSCYPSFTPDGRSVLVGNEPSGVQQLWDLAEGKLIRSWRGGLGMIRPDGREVATPLADGTIEIQETSTGRVLRRFPTNPGGCCVLFYSPDGRLLVTNGVPWERRAETSYAQVWDAHSGRLVQTIRGHPGWVSQVRFTPDSRFMATAGYDRTVKLWDTRDWSLIRTIRGHTDAIDSLAFSPDGRRLVTGSYDGTVRLWDVETGRELHRMRGHFGFVLRVAFSPDGRRVASGGHDGITRLWDVNSGQEVLALAGHTGWIFGIAFRPDGNMLVSTGNDGIRVWDASPIEPDHEPIRMPTDPEEASAMYWRGDR
jgi:WD40 repeat protein/serine/threonine protein kinase